MHSDHSAETLSSEDTPAACNALGSASFDCNASVFDAFAMSTFDYPSEPIDQWLSDFANPVVGEFDDSATPDDEPVVCSEPVVCTEAKAVPQAVVTSPVESISREEPSCSLQESADQPAASVDVPVEEAVIEPVVESVNATAIEPITETVDDSATEPIVASIITSIIADTVEALPEPIEEFVAKSVAKSVSKAPIKPMVKPMVKPAFEAPIEPVVESKPKQVELTADATFRDLSLSEDVQKSVELAGYEKPTEIQRQIIPLMLEGRDLLAQSQTGTGKTAAFALPILSRIDVRRRKPQVLVLAPTRELAIQVAKSFSTYASCLPGFNVAAIYGGQDYEPQFKQLRRGVHVVVGTPGRVIDHIKRGTLDLSGIECLVLDEADEMLNMGFLDDVQLVLEQTPENRQVALFSATLPEPIRDIAANYLNDPAKVTIKSKTMTADAIRQRALFVAPRDKISVLIRILEAEETDGVIIFTKTKDATVVVAEQLVAEGLSAVALNGDMPQKVRERTIEQLKSGQLNILVATDVAARGLDVTRVSHVFNFDMPHDSESYIHRVGRTGRAGRSGEAIIFLTNAQRGRLRVIERLTKQPIEIVEPPAADEINAMRIKRFKQLITDTTAGPDLTVFKNLISEYATETGKPIEMIAAAIAQMGQQGRPFLLKDRPRRKEYDREEGRSSGRDGGRFERNDRGDRYGRDRNEQGGGGGGGGDFDQRPRRGGKGEGRVLGPPEQGMERFRIEVGWNDGVKPGNIVGAVANEGGLSGEDIGPIKISDSFSTIDLPAGLHRDVQLRLQQTWVAGRQLKLSRAGEARPETRPTEGTRPPRSSENRYEKPRGPKVHGSSDVAHGKPFQSGKDKKRKFKSQPQG